MSPIDGKTQSEAPVWWREYGPGVEPPYQPPNEDSLADLLRTSIRAHASNTAFSICLPNGLSASRRFDSVGEEAEAWAAYLRFGLGIEAGDRVAVQLPNSLGYPVAALGTLFAEGILVNINPLFTPSEMRQQLADSGARVLVIADLFANKVEEGTRDTAVEHVVTASLFHGFRAPLRYALHALLRYGQRAMPRQPDGVTRLDKALAAGRPWIASLRELPHQRHGDDTAVLQYTGGTTGTPKGAELSHANIIANLHQTRIIAGPAVHPGEDVVLTALPLYHIFAFTFNLLLFFQAGCHNVLCPSPRPPAKLRAAFRRYPITKFAAVNALFHGLLREQWFRKAPPRHLDFTVAGGTALQTPVGAEWADVVGSPIHEGYGLSETSPVVAVNPPGGEVRPGTIGVPLPGTEVRLFDDNGQDVTPDGGPGELAVRGPQVMKGYWRQPEATAATFHDDWFLTGDIATQDERGYLRIVDRKKDMIDVSGFNVYPNEVEQALIQHPAIDEVGVVGIPGAQGSEIVRAVVVRNDTALTEGAVIDWARRTLTNYKCPSEVLFRSELPKSAVGKVLRKDLRAISRDAGQ